MSNFSIFSLARNTTIVRSNYLWDEATHLYEKAM